jgi:hypothetical protein
MACVPLDCNNVPWVAIKVSSIAIETGVSTDVAPASSTQAAGRLIYKPTMCVQTVDCTGVRDSGRFMVA